MTWHNVRVMAGLEAEHDPWPEPAPLICSGSPEPYPTNALPEIVRLAVLEVQAFTKAPVPLVAGSAVAALSLSGQHLADVQRAHGLSGPAGLFLLTIAESGERKTTCDGYFLDPVREWESEQKLKAEPARKDYRGRFAAWEAAHDGLKNRVRQAAKAGRPTRDAADALADHEALKPEPPYVPRLIRVDETPESLAWGLAHEWPAAGLISSEAGLVLGSHGMGRDSLMRNLGLLNQLWDGKPLPISRRTSESFTVRGARLTVALQIQEATLRAFFEQSGGLARGTGFLSRFLVAWPESTQGQRLFTKPAGFPALERYQRALRGLLETASPIGTDGALAPPVLPLSPDAESCWIRFHDDIERELRPSGELADVRDVAAKAADNVARLACLFHVLAHGAQGCIGAESIEAAARLVAWHLTEARRFYGAVALPADLLNAMKLDAWLIEFEREKRHAPERKIPSGTVSTREAQQGGPLRGAKHERLDAALKALIEADRIREGKDGKRKLLRINPALLLP